MVVLMIQNKNSQFLYDKNLLSFPLNFTVITGQYVLTRKWWNGGVKPSLSFPFSVPMLNIYF